MNTALTGHLVLSTLHTNDAATTLPRLLDMQIESYLIASTVNVVIGQRLVRKICDECKTPKPMTDVERTSLKGVIPDIDMNGREKFFVAAGCTACNNTGYRGRIGIHEVLVPNQELREGILKRMSTAEIKKLAVQSGMTTMIQDGFQKAKAGVTTIEEVLHILYE